MTQFFSENFGTIFAALGMIFAVVLVGASIEDAIRGSRR